MAPLAPLDVRRSKIPDPATDRPTGARIERGHVWEGGNLCIYTGRVRVKG